MIQYDGKILAKVEKQLRRNCPSPESDLIELGKIVATRPNSEQSAKLRRLVLDIDDLTAQIRWHLGQALLLMETQPEILKAGEDDDGLIKGLGMLSQVKLRLRGYVREGDRVLYDDLSEQRRGGTVGGWIFHIMIDSVVYRAISVLDRVATLLWHVAGLPIERIYFRSGKIKKVHDTIGSVETANLLKIAESDLLNYIIKYRDGLTHTIKAYSRLAGYPPADHWETEDGQGVFWNADRWNAEMLFTLGNASYHQLLDALKHATSLCRNKWSIPSEPTKH